MEPEPVRRVLADNLRRARLDSGISLSELSRRSGIGKATLSALESGAGNPTIETVFSLSRALGAPISTLLEDSVPTLSVVRGDEQDVLSGPTIDLRMLRTLRRNGVAVEVFDQQIRTGGPQPSSGHIGTEHTIVQVGTLRVHVGEQTVDLHAGDAIAFDAHQPHSYEAIDGDVRSVLLLEYPPGEAQRVFDLHP
ncbi:helix-turn-helix domain-containing protein [Luteipulveratus mongoliensis]|uniref:HTH cro/C1-type domain-containing protein n=1 Tax=Luteipulveratus mongoliensis TaxID=571913 RepID=A0A0K1JHU3_9MICO|nr:XRE family transcriptional regulator [Luteipulveratus mongoliensis]AKU16279.1 hypothetical protein VV02_11070 [Luteipulveratus mongoliensis]